jgi:hypothetical protein
VGAWEYVTNGSIGPYREARYDHFCFWARLPSIIHEQALRSMRPFASEEVPGVRETVKNV